MIVKEKNQSQHLRMIKSKIFQDKRKRQIFRIYLIKYITIYIVPHKLALVFLKSHNRYYMFATTTDTMTKEGGKETDIWRRKQ